MKKNVYTCIIDLLCYTAEMNTIVNQLYFNKMNKKQKSNHVSPLLKTYQRLPILLKAKIFILPLKSTIWTEAPECHNLAFSYLLPLRESTLTHTASATLAFQFLEHRRCLSQKDCGTGLYLERPSPGKGHRLLSRPLHTFAVYFPVPLPLVLFKQKFLSLFSALPYFLLQFFHICSTWLSIYLLLLCFLSPLPQKQRSFPALLSGWHTISTEYF